MKNQIIEVITNKKVVKKALLIGGTVAGLGMVLLAVKGKGANLELIGDVIEDTIDAVETVAETV